mgnify:CR=1 FL=1
MYLYVDGVKSDKLTFGLGYYGRSFTLENPSCTEIGCKFSGPGKEGRCTKSAGTLAWFEIDEIIANNQQYKPKLDSGSMSKILTWNKDQWVAYDDEETLALRRQYARKHCLKGKLLSLFISHCSKFLFVIRRCNDLEYRSRIKQCSRQYSNFNENWFSECSKNRCCVSKI